VLQTIDVSTGYAPHPYQLEIHRKMKRFNVLVCHRRFGKTYLAINTLIDAALRKLGEYAYVAPYKNQARDITWKVLARYTAHLPGARINESQLSITLPGGSTIKLYGSDNDQAIRGIGLNGVVCDEVADFRPETWPEVILPTLATTKGWALHIGTPKGMDQFHDIYQQAQTDPEWYAGMYRVDETNLITADELARQRASMTDAQFRREYLCDFSASLENVLISIDQVSESCQRHHDPKDFEGVPKVMGVDVARFGDDRCVIQRRQGLMAHKPLVFQNIDNMQFAAQVVQQINAFQPDAVFIDAGRGEGVIDRLRQLGYAVIEVNFGGRPDNPRYANKRSEMWDSLAQWIRDGGAIPNDSGLKTDLCVPTYAFDASNRMQLEKKEDIKKRGMRSPDLADALALTFAYPVAARHTPYNPILSIKPGIATHDYDPFMEAA